MQLELINSLRKVEVASGNKGMLNEKLGGKFLLLINSLQTTNQQEKSSPKVAQDQQKEGLNQLLALLSSSSKEIPNEEISMSLEKLWNTYYDISDQSGINDLEATDMEGIIAATFIKIENKITQVLIEGQNSRITPEMFNHTELPDLFSDLKLLEKTVKSLPDLTINEKIAETVEDLQGFILSLNNFLEQNMYSNESIAGTVQSAEQNVEPFVEGERERKKVAAYTMITSEAISGKENLVSGASIVKEIENQKVVNNGILKNSTGNSLSEDIAKTKNIESVINHNMEDFPNVFSKFDTKLLALQNSLLQENKNIIGCEQKRTTQAYLNQEAETENHVIAATTELKTIISSILGKLDKQLVEKNTILPKIVNPIMVSSLRKSGELLGSNTEIKGNVEVGEGDTDTKILSSIPTTFLKQDPLMLLSDSGEAIHSKRVEEQFVKILANSTFTKTSDMQKLTIRLAPDHLGSIRIEITQNEGNMIARIITANTEAKDVLEKQLTSLKHGLTAQNLQVDKVDIVVSPQPQDRLQRDQQQEQQHPHQQREKKDENDDENKQKASFIEELLNIEV
ncbi:flagellar hook-length control protein FliK [Niallia circulans]|uniref:flagellar hook-length control protein FliK n=1 Tax=Niallia circulans TaxID=1397 RepID=UPI003D9692E2